MLQITDLCTKLFGPVSLSIKQGECIAILGASGSGKSLLLRAIADLDPNDGELSLNGQNRNDTSANIWRQQVALVPAETGWWADHVKEHFLSCPAPTNFLEIVDLPNALDWEVSRLSTGERHRLAIARALQRGPKVLLLDEPTAALDSKAAQKIETLIEQQKTKGTIVLLVTHNYGQARRLASKAFTLVDGELTPLPESDT